MTITAAITLLVILLVIVAIGWGLYQIPGVPQPLKTIAAVILFLIAMIVVLRHFGLVAL